MMKALLPLLFLFIPALLPAEEHPELRHFPEAEGDLVRSVLVLEEKPNEEDHKVELLVGEILLTDGVNVKRMGGSLEEKTLSGWGYTYYVAEKGPVLSTLMAPLPGQEEVERFVSLPGKLIRYNSRLPVVIFHPEGMELRYRIWTAGEENSLKDVSK